jgi:uncharacterized membrane protein
MINWHHSGPAVVAAFLASLVEFVEALTIVLAVGITRGWRWALIGSAAGTVLLILLTLTFGPALQLVPLAVLQLVVGILLLLFGMRWLRKAILRAAGSIGLHDEAKIFASQTKLLGAVGIRLAHDSFDGIAFVTTFKAVLIEGLEVIFIVIAVGATAGMLLPAGLGAAAAAILVLFLGIVLHRPLARVPENALKFSVGVLLSAFGVFWIGEGLRFPWPGEDWSIPALAAAFLCFAGLAVAMAKRQALAANLAAQERHGETIETYTGGNAQP